MQGINVMNPVTEPKTVLIASLPLEHLSFIRWLIHG